MKKKFLGGQVPVHPGQEPVQGGQEPDQGGQEPVHSRVSSTDLNPLLSFPSKVTPAPNPSTLLCHYSLLQVAFGFLSFVFSHILTISSFVDTLITIK